ncbi:TetR family transcriptional regulator [Acinetobacter sp. ANC 4648]|uniref:TetR family transcriptional regulator n=1 Tax=Acinetobacter sp. ANC 4648 TaxID=1977875 RepID=UPI000A34B8E2|nr:TetR/AcrR family transcriptional regulator [Acinetobacter sp. ANC 4648]OTG83781.1 TetR family transcriptional regulator [Acinetobacter sp. ANC 4648]
MTKNVSGLRPGGRSARIQAAVHQAVLQLQEEMEQDLITVPLLAHRAGVTPSTIYRRWGNINQLFSDVALLVLQPDNAPKDLGSYPFDLYAWVEQYFEEYSSQVGRGLLRDILASKDLPDSGKCAEYICQQLNVINERALGRKEQIIPNQEIIDRIIAPILFQILFVDQPPQMDYVTRLLDRLLQENNLLIQG